MIEKYQSFDEAFKKVRNVAAGVFLYGDTMDTKQIKNAISNGCINEKLIVKAGLALVYSTIPKNIKNKLLEKPFEHYPFIKQRDEVCNVPMKIGSGSLNSVYLIKEGDKSYALSLNRLAFKDVSSAVHYAKQQEEEHKYYKDIFKNNPNLILSESYLVYEKCNNSPSIMFIREFLEGPIKDVFLIGREELGSILNNNPRLEQCFDLFVNTLIKNRDLIEDEQLDLLGVNNLAIAGPVGKEKLILLDPHTKTCKTSESRQRIHNRISYLQEIYVERSISMGEFFYSATLEHNYINN